MIIIVEPDTVIGQRQAIIINGEQGVPGAPSKVSFSTLVSGSYGPRNPLLPAPLILPGMGVFDPARCHARSFAPCTGIITWDVTKNGTFASESVATNTEVAAAIFAHVAFPAGPGSAVWTFPAGGAYSDGDILRIWQSASGPDATQNLTSLTFAGD